MVDTGFKRIIVDKSYILLASLIVFSYLKMTLELTMEMSKELYTKGVRYFFLAKDG